MVKVVIHCGGGSSRIHLSHLLITPIHHPTLEITLIYYTNNAQTLSRRTPTLYAPGSIPRSNLARARKRTCEGRDEGEKKGGLSEGVWL